MFPLSRLMIMGTLLCGLLVSITSHAAPTTSGITGMAESDQNPPSPDDVVEINAARPDDEVDEQLDLTDLPSISGAHPDAITQESLAEIEAAIQEASMQLAYSPASTTAESEDPVAEMDSLALSPRTRLRVLDSARTLLQTIPSELLKLARVLVRAGPEWLLMMIVFWIPLMLFFPYLHAVLIFWPLAIAVMTILHRGRPLGQGIRLIERAIRVAMDTVPYPYKSGISWDPYFPNGMCVDLLTPAFFKPFMAVDGPLAILKDQLQQRLPSHSQIALLYQYMIPLALQWIIARLPIWKVLQSNIYAQYPTADLSWKWFELQNARGEWYLACFGVGFDDPWKRTTGSHAVDMTFQYLFMMWVDRWRRFTLEPAVREIFGNGNEAQVPTEPAQTNTVQDQEGLRRRRRRIQQ